ncbi:MAG TPA: hypothetical protein VGM05_16740 [Planctomycetaceae bacterium]|jgi:hypothetical protein
MAILLPALAVVFGAFCVWLIVRNVNRRERWAKWTLAVALAVLLAYPFSVGPAFCVLAASGEPEWMQSAIEVFYWPVAAGCPAWLYDTVEDYINWWFEFGEQFRQA